MGISLKLLRQRVTKPIDGVFYRHGVRVARWPKATILFSLLVTAVSMAGLTNFHQKTNWVDIWVPPYAVSFKIVKQGNFTILL